MFTQPVTRTRNARAFMRASFPSNNERRLRNGKFLCVVLALVGCGGGTKSGSPDASAANPLTSDEVMRACVSAYSCLFEAFGNHTAGYCINDLSDSDTFVSEWRPEQMH